MALGIRLAGKDAVWALKWLRQGVSLVSRSVKVLAWQAVKGPSEGWMTFLLLLLSVVLGLWVAGGGRWVANLQLYGVVLCGTVAGLLLAKRSFSAWLLFAAGLLVGFALSFYQVMLLTERATWLDRSEEVGTRVFVWVQAFLSGGTSTDTLPFGLFALLAAWLVGFVSSWFLFRRHSIWGALLPGGFVVVASVLSFPSAGQVGRLYLYLFVAFLFAARLFSLESQLDWQQRGIQYLARGSGLRLPHAFWFAVVAVVVTSLLPIQPARVDPVAAAWDKISSPMRVVGEEFGRVLGGVPAEGPYSGHSFGSTQAFGGASSKGESPVLLVEAPRAVYLAARSYDFYTHQGWETSDTVRVSPGSISEEWLEAAGVRRLESVEVRVTSLFSLRGGEPVFVAGYPLTMSIDYQLDVLKPARYEISIVAAGVDGVSDTTGLPPDLQKSVVQLRELHDASPHHLTEALIRSVLPDDVWVVSWEWGTEGVEGFVVERRLPVPPDTVAVRATRASHPGGSYEAAVKVSAAVDYDLRAAGTEYPGWVMDRYLQLPETMPSRVMDLAQGLTGDAETQYDKAVAVRSYLRTLDYALDIEAPPDGADGVEYFLYDLEKGYCSYFASAMAVLLRASGVPSRVAVGYGPGEIVGTDLRDGIAWSDSEELHRGRKAFTVANSHSWCEVFFPGYGWIIFEPTPSYPVVARIGPSVPPTGDIGVDAVPGEGEAAGPLPDAEYDTGGLPGADGHDKAITLLHLRPTSILVALAVLGMLLWLSWRRLLGRVSEPRVAYSRIGRLAALSRLAPQASLTPYEYGRRLSAAMPNVSAELNSLVDAYVRVCYGGCRVTADDGSHVALAWPRVRDGLLRRAIRGLLPRRFW